MNFPLRHRHFPALPWLLGLIMAMLAPAWSREMVRMEICEQGLNDKDEWPAAPPAATEESTIPAFGLDAIPHKYVDDGVRGTRPSPSLLRLKARITFPQGKHRILLRARSAARLTIGDKVVVQTPFAPKSGGDGSQANTEHLVPIDLGVGFRFAPEGEYERLVEFEGTGEVSDVCLEAFVGGREGKNPRRVELGETVAAISWAGSTSWEVLQPAGDRILYTDAEWKRYSRDLEELFEKRSAAKRAELRAGKSAWWANRRKIAHEWLASVSAIDAPFGPRAIDHFLEAKFHAIKKENQHASPDAVDFLRDVKPILESRCLDCHRGAKAKGDLKLDTKRAALLGGESGPAVVPGEAATSELLRRIRSHDEDEVMPPKGEPLTEAEIAILVRWVNEGASWPELPLVRTEIAPPVDDLAFLRRLSLDTIGLFPTVEELRSFLAETSPDKRSLWIDRRLADPRWADHWMGFWQDLLAENPNILNPTLNNTGPFRWWLYEALKDDLPLDRMVTQLILQRGGRREGGPAGFGDASQNDAPFATKGTVVSSAFLGIDMKCARCHDSPSGSALQEQLFQLGAMLAAEPLDVPTTSSVDPVRLHAGGRKPLIEVTLKPGTKVAPGWPFANLAAPTLADTLAENPKDQREKLAALLTAPQNERFAQVIVNRLWQRLMGRGIVEPVDDWEKGSPTHPGLLQWLGRELVRQDYQLKPIAKLILSSAAYQRAVDQKLRQPDPLYTAAEPRRLSAEQVVDSLFATTGTPFEVERVSLDLNGRRETNNSINLGKPHRAWMLASLSNERDRPSLTLPRLQAVADVMSALGWRGSRQDPASVRDTAPDALQPAILANGVMTGWLTRLSEDHGFTPLALQDQPLEILVSELFHRLLSRPPTPAELEHYLSYLKPDYDRRILANAAPLKPPHVAPKLVTWTNHLLPESNLAKQEMEIAARQGNPPTPKLLPTWRVRCEDVIWALINSPEMLYRP